MARGVRSAPLQIHVADEWYTRPEVLALMRAGHHVHNMNTVPSGTADLILHRAAGWTEDLFTYLPVALTRARARRRTT